VASELERIIERYDDRDDGRRYNILHPANWKMYFERQQAVLQMLNKIGLQASRDTKFVDVGAGAGNNLLEMIRFGFDPGQLIGIELLASRVTEARHRLPGTVTLIHGDASVAQIEPSSVDIVHQSVVFSSLLDDDFQACLADAMWRWAKPGGGILWYDFTYNNPRNLNVRGVPLRRVRELFPHGFVRHKRVTLAPPIARAAVAVHPRLYDFLNWSLLRTHILCWIEKPATRID
jgi:SAM-dependent methyltransferase